MRVRTTKQIPDNYDVPSFTQEEIKNQGKVYTPKLIVQDIISRYTSKIINAKSICDPSMGQGNFLRGIFEQLISTGLSPNDSFSKLYGFDIDSIAVQSSQQYFIDIGIDSVIVRKHLQCINPVIELNKFKNNFDIIIGNPPYVRSPSDIPNFYSLTSNLVDVFFEVGMEMLKDGGTLIYIVQDSFLTNEDIKLRNYIKNHNIVTIEQRYDYSKIFRQFNVAVDICLIELEKNIQQNQQVNVYKHQSFQLQSSVFNTQEKWLIYPPQIIELNQTLQQFDRKLSDHTIIKKGRLENKTGCIPASYGSTTYSKNKTDIFNMPVIGEPNLDYFFPKLPYQFVNFTKKVKLIGPDNFIPFIALPYFTSKFRFCLIEDDVLTTPLVYTFTNPNIEWLLPILNSSVTDFQIRYNTKSRDTGYEFKKSTFDIIKFPNITPMQQKQLINLVDLIKKQDISFNECDEWVCDNIYNINTEQLKLIQECQYYWFKKHVSSVTHPPQI